MKIRGIEGMTIQEVQSEVNAGGKFVIFSYCFSIIVMSFKRPTDIYFIKSTENAFVKSLPYTLLTLVLGWWGIPWGIIYSFGCLGRNIGGGKNVTEVIMQGLYAQKQAPVFEFEEA
jgi:hypothetical protein